MIFDRRGKVLEDSTVPRLCQLKEHTCLLSFEHYAVVVVCHCRSQRDDLQLTASLGCLQGFISTDELVGEFKGSLRVLMR